MLEKLTKFKEHLFSSWNLTLKTLGVYERIINHYHLLRPQIYVKHCGLGLKWEFEQRTVGIKHIPERPKLL